MTTLLTLALACSRPEPGPGRPPPPDENSPTTDTEPPSPTDTSGDTGAAPPASGACGEPASTDVVGGSGNDRLAVLAVGADGTLAAGGSFSGGPLAPDGPGEAFVARGPTDGIVLRYAPDGNYAWARQMASPTLASVVAVAVAADGGVVAGGSFGGTVTLAAGEPDDVVLTSPGASVAGYVARFDPDGQLAWAQAVEGWVEVNDVAVLADGSVLVVGGYRDTMRLGAGQPGETVLRLPDGAWRSGFVARFDPAGQLVWAESAEGIPAVTLRGAAVDPITGELVVIGLVSGPGAVTLPGDPPIPFETEAVTGGFLARWDTAGGARALVGLSGLAPEEVEVADDGGVVVGGTVEGPAVLGLGEPGETTLDTLGTDAFAARFAPDGSLSWAAQSRAADAGGAAGAGIAATADGGAVLVGDFTAAIVLGTGEPGEVRFDPQGGFGDAFVARFDPAGALLCAAAISSPGWDLAGDVDRRADGTFTTTGEVDGAALVAPGSPWVANLPSAGGLDSYLVSWWF